VSTEIYCRFTINKYTLNLFILLEEDCKDITHIGIVSFLPPNFIHLQVNTNCIQFNKNKLRIALSDMKGVNKHSSWDNHTDGYTQSQNHAFLLTFWCWNYFLILAHPVYKMWIKQEPNKLELWNKMHFEEEKTKSIHHV